MCDYLMEKLISFYHFSRIWNEFIIFLWDNNSKVYVPKQG